MSRKDSKMYRRWEFEPYREVPKSTKYRRLRRQEELDLSQNQLADNSCADETGCNETETDAAADVADGVGQHVSLGDVTTCNETDATAGGHSDDVGQHDGTKCSLSDGSGPSHVGFSSSFLQHHVPNTTDSEFESGHSDCEDESQLSTHEDTNSSEMSDTPSDDNTPDPDSATELAHEEYSSSSELINDDSVDGDADTIPVSPSPPPSIGSSEIEFIPDEVDSEVIDEEDEVPDNDLNLRRELCPCTTTTLGDAIFMCLSLGMHHSLTWKAMVDILNLINRLFDSEVIPASKYFLLKYVEVGKDETMYHIFCSHCGKYHGERNSLAEKDCECGKALGSTFFLSLKLKAQLKRLLETPGIARALDSTWNSRLHPNTESYKNIFDGQVYRDLSKPGQILSDRYNYSYTFNTDGCPFGKASQQTVWPIYIMLNELPSHLRSKHMMLAGIWVGEKEPNMDIFLQSFVDECNNLSSEGVDWSDGGFKRTSKIIPICCSVDSVARCKLLNMKSFAGYYGCTLCDIKGESVLLSEHKKVKGVRFTVSELVSSSRTHENVISDMLTVQEMALENPNVDCSYRGVKGPCPLINLQNFNLVRGMVPDYMHSVLLGVVKRTTDLLLSSPKKDYYIGSPANIDVIDSRLLSVTPPTIITRTPRSVKCRKLWKASEWRSWILFYCLVCVKDILPKKYVMHLAALSSALHILLQKAISHEQLLYAQSALANFVVMFENYFGPSNMVYNVHLLTHIVSGVIDWGPLWTHNAFSFEGMNRQILKMQKSPKSVAKQICRRFLTYRALPCLATKLGVSENTISFIEDMSGRRLQKFTRPNEHTILIGSGSERKMDFNLKEAFATAGIYGVTGVEVYDKMIHRGVRYTSQHYRRATKTDDSTVILTGGISGRIDSIFKLTLEEEINSVAVLVREFDVDRRSFVSNDIVKVRHIKRYKETNRLRAHTANEIVGHCIIIKANSEQYLCDIPYGCRGD